jgi:hypothetical protein
LLAHDLVRKPVTIPDYVEDKLFGIMRQNETARGLSAGGFERIGTERISAGARRSRPAAEYRNG